MPFAACQNCSGQNLLVNGSFEQNDRHTYANYYTSEDLAYLAPSDSFPGWTFSHSVDLYGPVHNPANANQYLDLVGGGPVSLDFSIQQTFATTPGASYQLSFSYGNNEQLAAALASFTLRSWGARERSGPRISPTPAILSPRLDFVHRVLRGLFIVHHAAFS
ncbi:MAG: hypothetical protein DLM73_06050 [Chthoniobacterales bacterium]|nr:MAG: hypothetical protein DLM73_06050 [Chthoniobacterales bacterium]